MTNKLTPLNRSIDRVSLATVFEWILHKLTRGRATLKGRWVLNIGIGIVAFFVLLTVVSNGFPGLIGYHPTEYRSAPRLQPPTAQHWMGTDQLQRDVFSRIIAGGYASIIVAFAAVALSLTAGSILGWISGFTGGWVDRILSLTMDALY